MARDNAASRRKAGATKGGSFSWLQGLVCGAVLAFATPVALLAGVLLAPCIVAAVLDSRPGRPVARTVALAGLSLTLAPLWHLVMNGRTMDEAVALVIDPAVTGPAWLAAACGWALCEILPVLLRVAADLRAAARLSMLQAEEKALRETWDFEER